MKLKRHARNLLNQGFSTAAGLGLPLRENDKRLLALSGCHAGESCVVIAMGPSLKNEDLSRLTGHKTFACNKIFLSYPHTPWRPDYYFIVDHLVAQQNRDEILGGDFSATQRFFPPFIHRTLGSPPDAIRYPYRSNFAGVRNPGFPQDIVRGIYSHGCTVIFDMLQFAYFMGFETVYIIGLDFSFNYSQQDKTEEMSRSGKVLVSQGETNHFHKDYRKPGEKWTLPDMEGQKSAFRYAKAAFEANGRKLLNASRKSELDVLEKVDFEKIFAR